MSRELFYLILALAPAVVAADEVGRWSASAITATPHFAADNAINTASCVAPACAHGRGLKLIPAFIGAAYVYLPVVLPPGTIVNRIRLRAEDNNVNHLVTAELMRQPNNGNLAAAVVIPGAAVSTINIGGDGFQAAEALFVPHAFATATCSYYIRVTMRRGAAVPSPTAYDVSLLN